MRRRLRAIVRRWLWAEPADDVVVGVGRCVPGWLVRVFAGAVAAALVATCGLGSARWATGPVIGFMALAFALVAWWPGTVVLALALAGLVVLVAGVPPLGLLLALVLLVHLAGVLAGLASRVRYDTLVEWRVIGGLLRELAVVQVGAQVLAVGAAALAGAELRAGDGVRTAALLTALVVLVVVLPRTERVVVRRR